MTDKCMHCIMLSCKAFSQCLDLLGLHSTICLIVCCIFVYAWMWLTKEMASASQPSQPNIWQSSGIVIIEFKWIFRIHACVFPSKKNNWIACTTDTIWQPIFASLWKCSAEKLTSLSTFKKKIHSQLLNLNFVYFSPPRSYEWQIIAVATIARSVRRGVHRLLCIPIWMKADDGTPIFVKKNCNLNRLVLISKN